MSLEAYKVLLGPFLPVYRIIGYWSLYQCKTNAEKRDHLEANGFVSSEDRKLETFPRIELSIKILK